MKGKGSWVRRACGLAVLVGAGALGVAVGKTDRVSAASNMEAVRPMVAMATSCTRPSDSCRVMIPLQNGTTNKITPYGYFIDRCIDKEDSDEEYVFKFVPRAVISKDRYRWWSNSRVIRDMAGWRWGGLLGGVMCQSPLYVYADKLAVDLTGGPGYWMSQIYLWY